MDYCIIDGDSVTTRFYIDGEHLYKRIDDNAPEFLREVDLDPIPKENHLRLKALARRCGVETFNGPLKQRAANTSETDGRNKEKKTNTKEKNEIQLSTPQDDADTITSPVDAEGRLPSNQAAAMTKPASSAATKPAMLAKLCCCLCAPHVRWSLRRQSPEVNFDVTDAQIRKAGHQAAKDAVDALGHVWGSPILVWATF